MKLIAICSLLALSACMSPEYCTRICDDETTICECADRAATPDWSRPLFDRDDKPELPPAPVVEPEPEPEPDPKPDPCACGPEWVRYLESLS